MGYVCNHLARLLSRRHALAGIIGSLASVAIPQRGVAIETSSDLPIEVAGITLPRSALAQKAAQFSRAHCPDYLFNHCMRTFLFGAVALRTQNRGYDAEKAFAAAALHDLGLLPAFASPQGSFEIDGANRAEQLMLESGLSAHDADTVWHAIVLHDVRFALAKRQGAEAMLVAMGAGCDVDGPDPQSIDAAHTAEIVAAFPRLQFKKRFTALAIDHCKRKPLSQRSTWLEGLCREQVPAAWTDTVEHDIASAPFSE
jgi:HD domain